MVSKLCMQHTILFYTFSYFPFVVLLLELAALSVSASDDALYKSYLLPESSSNISQHDSGTAISTRRCAIHCMKNEECNGFTYDRLTKKCSVKTCVNPNLYSEGNNDYYDFYVGLKVLENFSKLLARCEYIYILFLNFDFSCCQ